MRVPRATYRLQFNGAFTFADAAPVLDYLAALGVSDVYASPVFRMRTGSAHGYDVVDPNQVHPELGGREGLERLAARARTLGLGWVQDIVPNHMALDPANRMLMDVFETGACSAYAGVFDLSWDHPDESLRGRLLAPLLGKPYGEALDAGEIGLEYEDGTLRAKTPGGAFPLFIPSYRFFLAQGADAWLRTEEAAGREEAAAAAGLKRLLDDWALGPEPGRPSAGHCALLRDLKARLADLVRRDPRAREFVAGRLALFNDVRDARSRDLLDALLSQQRFRLAYWRVAAEELNYRRFFTINGLIGLRVEDPEVMRAVHALALELVRAGVFTGLRVDHVDGLHRPADYLRELRAEAGDVYVVVEKILGAEERLPPAWPVQGTTGYDSLAWTNALFCPTRNGRAFDRLYARVLGAPTDFAALAAEKRRWILQKDMTGDLENLARELRRIAQEDRRGRDLTLPALRGGLAEIMIRFPVYRTYLGDASGRDEDDLRYLEEALREARAREPDFGPVFDWFERAIVPAAAPAAGTEAGGRAGDPFAPAAREFLSRFQQFTGPLTAKGFEDSLLYVFARLASLNEVGGSPQDFGLTARAFHERVGRRAQAWPHAMTATATHDTKRGEDARARLNVLAEIPAEWGRAWTAWRRANAGKKAAAGGRAAPEANDEYLLYQTLLGARPFDRAELPAFRGRVRDYTVKALREAKVRSSWLKPDEAYEAACLAFVDRLLGGSGGDAFDTGFERLAGVVAFYGVFNSLSQVLIKAAAPGVPDFYQGTELWDFSLVDPDNRRPVDYARRAEMLKDVRERCARDPAAAARELLAAPEDGRVKLFLVHRLLAARRENEALFAGGGYRPLATSGARKDSVVAFGRVLGDAWAIAAAPRFLTSVVPLGRLPVGADVWKDTAVAIPGGFEGADAVTGRPAAGSRTLRAGDLFADFPAALLVGTLRPNYV